MLRIWIILMALGLPASALDIGFAAVACGHDDPLDQETRSDYTDEVAGWTTLNHVCLGTPDETLARLLRVKPHFTPLLHVEPVFFEGGKRMRWQPAADELWAIYAEIIKSSGVAPVFYLADEPQLRKLDLALISRAAKMIRADFPDAKIAVIEAFLPNAPLIISDEIDLWGFNAYTLRDPGQDRAYMAHLAQVENHLLPHQNMILVADANHTRVHRAMGLGPDDMADVALAYERLARSNPRITALIGYTWAGGIDWPDELGVRDMPAHVQDTWRAIGTRARP